MWFKGHYEYRGGDLASDRKYYVIIVFPVLDPFFGSSVPPPPSPRPYLSIECLAAINTDMNECEIDPFEFLW